MSRAPLPVVVLLLALAAHGCACERLSAREVPGFDDRSYAYVTPAGDGPFPVLLVLHGGGSNRRSTERLTCEGGVLTSDACLALQGPARGYAVVFPDGTGAALADSVRTWNAGGGTGELECVSGRACAEGVDDIAYFDALLADLPAAFAVDERRVFATGISNGGAMSHRLACDRADVIAGIAPVAGGNQHAAAGDCAPSRPVPVLQIHGDADPAWPFGGGASSVPTVEGDMAPIAEGAGATIPFWSAHDGCDATPEGA